jgi:hypothetical protein
MEWRMQLVALAQIFVTLVAILMWMAAFEFRKNDRRAAVGFFLGGCGLFGLYFLLAYVVNL